MSLANLPIRRLLALLSAAILICCAVSGAVAVSQARRADQAQQRLTAQLSTRFDVDRLAVLASDVKLNLVIMQYIPVAAATGVKNVHDDEAEIDAIVKRQASAALSGQERDAVAAVGASIRAYADWALGQGKVTTAAELKRVGDEYTVLVGTQAAAIKHAQSLTEADGAKQLAEVDRAKQGFLLLMVVFCLSGAIVLPTLLLLFGRRLAGRLTLLGEALGKMAQGDLTVQVPDAGRDEVSVMARSVNDTVRKLAATLSTIHRAGGRLSSSATALQDVAAQVRITAEDTFSRAEVVARSADEVSRNVQTVATGSEEMGTSISEIARNANEAASVATGAVQAVEATTGTMTKLSDSSREIGDVVRLITSIAEQTNLLALNATIEAARAGDAGKGFAVVADEVKQLAQETARATGDISRRVEAIQGDAERAAQSIIEVAGVISRINEFQTVIAAAVEEQTATTASINHGVVDAAAGSGQIAQNISGVASAAGQTAASMVSTSSSAAEVGQISQELAELIGAFRFWPSGSGLPVAATAGRGACG